MLESMLLLEHGARADLSEADLFYCGGGSCANGWWVDDAINRVKSAGVPAEHCYPYTANQSPCITCANRAELTVKAGTSVAYFHSDSRKYYLADVGPMVACMDVFEDFDAYSGGIYRHVAGERRGGHCVLVIGYNEADGCWICKNSWGAGWGEGGFFRIAYGECGIDSDTRILGLQFGSPFWGISNISATPWYSQGQGSRAWILQTSTALHETDDSFAFAIGDYTGDGRPDIYAIKKSGTGTNSTEVHVLSAASNYQQWALQTGTPLHETDETFDFAIGDFDGSGGKPDLFAIKKRGTGTNSTEIHVLSGESNYQQWILQTGTPLLETDGTFAFGVGDYTGDGRGDVFAIRKSSTETSTTEVHILSAASGYQQWVLQTRTALHQTDDTFDFALGDFDGLFVIKKSGTGTNSTELHVLSRASNYRSWVLQTGTPLHETDASFAFGVGDYNADGRADLFVIKKRSTGTNTTEVHVLAG